MTQSSKVSENMDHLTSGLDSEETKPEAASPQPPTAAGAAGQTTPAPGLMDGAADLDSDSDKGSSSAVRATCA